MALTADGTLVTLPEVDVTDRVRNPLGREAPSYSIGVAYTVKGTDWWSALRHWLGLSVEETAAELGIATGTVKSHTSRGLESLQAALALKDA